MLGEMEFYLVAVPVILVFTIAIGVKLTYDAVRGLV